LKGYDCRPDLCATDCSQPPKEFLGKFYTDTLVHSKPALDLLVEVIGEVKKNHETKNRSWFCQNKMIYFYYKE
jgi:hypothetical protein